MTMRVLQVVADTDPTVLMRVAGAYARLGVEIESLNLQRLDAGRNLLTIGAVLGREEADLILRALVRLDQVVSAANLDDAAAHERRPGLRHGRLLREASR